MTGVDFVIGELFFSLPAGDDHDVLCTTDDILPPPPLSTSFAVVPCRGRGGDAP